MATDPRTQFGPAAERYLTSAAHAKVDELAALMARIDPQGRVLDIGTGAGHTAYALASAGCEVVAYDMTPEMLSLVSREAEARGLGSISVQEGVAESLDFSDAEFDGVACRLAAHHFDDPAAFIAESFRVVKPGGWLLLIDTVSPEDPETATELDEIETLRDPSHRHDLSVSEWGSLVENVGFGMQWVDVARKPLDLEDWLTRMSVEDHRAATLRELILDSEGPLRKYLSPVILPDQTTFDLWEMTLFARRPLS